MTQDVAPTWLPLIPPSAKQWLRESPALLGLERHSLGMTSPQRVGEGLRSPTSWHHHTAWPKPGRHQLWASVFTPHLPNGVDNLSILNAKDTGIKGKGL